MAVLMSDRCAEGVDLIWKQCNEELYPQGLSCLEEAAAGGDPEAFYFLGHCYSWGDGTLGFNDKKAYECYLAGAGAGSARCVLGAVRAGQYDEGMKAAARLSLLDSFRAVEAAARAGEAFAAYQLAEAYYYEDFFDVLPKHERSAANCFRWYERAGQGGVVQAMEKAGRCCLAGTYTRKDLAQALVWADLAAAAGNVWGLAQMGSYYLEKAEPEAAFAYFYAAAMQGDDKAPYHLGRMLAAGIGAEKDTAQAIAFFEMAAMRENKDCLAELGDLYFDRGTPERDDEKALYWYGRAYAAGTKRAALPLGLLLCRCREGQDQEAGLARAEKYLAEAASWETDGTASLALGDLYRREDFSRKDLEKAVALYEKGAALGNTACMEILGNMAFSSGGEEGFSRAYLYFNQAEEQGGLTSFYQLGHLLHKGLGCEKDEIRAIALLKKAIEQKKDGQAYYELGYIYETGTQAPHDLEQAVDCYRQAVLLENDSARRRLAHFKRNLFGKWKVSY